MQKPASKPLFLLILAALLAVGLCLVALACLLVGLNVDRLYPPARITPVAGIQAFTPSPTFALTSTPVLSTTQTRPPRRTRTPRVTATSEIALTPGLTQTSVLPEFVTPVTLPISGTPTTTLAIQPLDDWCIPWNTSSQYVQVTKVIDGVSFEAQVNGQQVTVDYIGLDLPEYDQDFSVWERAYQYNKSLVDGKSVLLVSDRTDRDELGHLRRYVLVDNVFVNQRMAAAGYAVAASTPPDIRCDSLLTEAEMQAISSKLGVWMPKPTPTRTMIAPTATSPAQGSVVIIKVSPRGTLWEEPEEYVEIFNAGTIAVQLKNWTLHDNDNHIFTFPGFILGPQQYCRVYTDLYRPQNCGFSYFSPSPIWDNHGDCASIMDADGNLVSKYCYE
jgi:endonuclease YncB( thermonuclease family)